MDNRRQNYRHTFPATSCPGVECEFAIGKLKGEIIDLSISGMKARVFECPAYLDPGQGLRVRFSLPTEPRLVIESVLVHGPRNNDSTIGIRFVPLPDQTANEARSKLIWAFLLEEQAKKRRFELAKRHG